MRWRTRAPRRVPKGPVRVMLVCGVLIGAAVAPAHADFPYVGSGTLGDPLSWKLAPGQTPTNDAGDWKFAATPEPLPSSNPDVNRRETQADELCGVRGDSLVDAATTEPAGSCLSGAPVHTAFGQTLGRPSVVIAVLDSGIEWNDASAMVNLRRKVHLNAGELPAPWIDPNMAPLDSAVTSCATLASAAAGAVGGASGGTLKNPNGVYDVFGNGAFNVTDYACDPRVGAIAGDPRRLAPSGLMTPQDLILAFGHCKLAGHQIDAVVGCPAGQRFDNDGNGLANDIAGWNFVDDNNDPYDDVHYGHGTGEARDSNAEAQSSASDSTTDLGTCPNCEVLPLRVGESFVTDVNRFAQAAVYATDQGVSVIQEALGTLNSSTFARQAIDYAFNHGTTVIASAADEAAQHHNQPGALPHTIVVNSATQYTPATETPGSYLQFNGCTNFSTKVTISVPSVSCSSEATGKSAGVAGLIYSAAINAIAQHKLSPSSDCRRVDASPCPITPDEVRQLMGSGNIAGTASQTGGPPSDGRAAADEGNGGQADDINFAASPEPSCASAPTITCTDPNSNTSFAPDQNGGAVSFPKTTRYHARKGFDEFYGFGRLNAYNAVSAAAAGNIPPEADIASPDWFSQIDPASGTLEVDGHTFARGANYTCELDVAPGSQPNNAMTTGSPAGDFAAVPGGYCDGSTQHAGSFDGALGSISLATLQGMFPPGTSFTGNENGGAAQTANGRPNIDVNAFTFRVVVRTAATSGSPAMTGEDRRQAWLHHDADQLPGFPKELRTDGASSPLLVDLEGRDRNDLVLATSDGLVHAYRPDGTEAPGWPVHTDQLPLHTGESAYQAGALGTGHYGAILGGLAAGDLFHDGRTEIVADDNQGKVYAWDAGGHQVFKAEANPAFAQAMSGDEDFVRHGPRDRTEHGFLASPVLADLGGHGAGLDIIAAGEDRHLYAWHADGTPVAGFPVEIYDPDKVTSADPTSGHLTFNANADPNPGISQDQGKLVDTPAIAYLDGAGRPPSIVLGSNEDYPTDQRDEGPLNASLSNTTLAALGAANAQVHLLNYANGRLYVVNHDGNAGSSGPYRSGWPKKVGIIDGGLLPDVAEGITGPPVTARTTCAQGGTGVKIAAESYAGPAYLFNPDGTSCYGTGPSGDPSQPATTVDNAMATDFAAGTGRYDTPTFPSVGNPAFGLVGGALAYISPASGLQRALDAAVPEYQGGQDFLSAWNPQTGQFLAGWPAPVNDLSFLTGPAVGDVTGQPGALEDVVGGTASLDLQALNGGGVPASTSWPKLTGDWTVATPAIGTFGTLDTDAGSHQDVVSITRSGELAAYSTPAPACGPASWPRYHHDNANSGDYNYDAVHPGVPLNMAVSAGRLTFTSPGNDLMCGTPDHYEIVTSPLPITAQNFASATPLPGGAIPGPVPAGQTVSLALPNGLSTFLAVRAVGRQTDGGTFNLGLPAVVALAAISGQGDAGATAGTGGVSGGPVVSGRRPTGAAARVSFLGLPASSACVSRRSFTIHLRAPRGQRLLSAAVYLNGHRLRVIGGAQPRAVVNLQGRRRGSFTLRIAERTASVAHTRLRHSVSDVRTYHTCRSAKRRRAARSASWRLPRFTG